MSRGVNKVILIGNLGQEPEVRHMPAGGAVTTLSLATTENWKDKQTGEQQSRTEWHRVVLFNRLAEIAGEYLKKGARVYVEGSLRTRKWQDKTGIERYTTEIVGAEMQMLDTRTGGMQQSSPSYDDYSASSPMGSSSSSHSPEHNIAATSSTADFDDDIPF